MSSNTNLKVKQSCFCEIFLFFIVLIGIVVYYSFGVYVLASDYNSFETARLSCDTKIWYYVLVTMILNIDKLFFRKYFYIKNNVKFYVTTTLIEIMLVIFGGIELFSNDNCLKLNNNEFFYTNLWRFAIGNFIIQLFLSLIFTVKLLEYLCQKNNIDNNIEDNYYNINENDNIGNNENLEIDRIINHAYLEDSVKSFSFV